MFDGFHTFKERENFVASKTRSPTFRQRGELVFLREFAVHFFHFLDGNRVKLFRKFSLFSFLESIFRDFLKKIFLFYGKFSRDWTDFQRSLKTIYTIFDNFHIFILREALTYAKLFSLKNFFLTYKNLYILFSLLRECIREFFSYKKIF